MDCHCKMSKVAVLIPTCEPKEYFERCLLSINKQSLGIDEFCVYIALNGQRKHYEDYVFELLGRMRFKWQYFYIEKPGISKARNKLIENFREEYFCFIDDDDLVSENYLENLLQKTTKDFMGISNILGFKDDIKKAKETRIGKTFLKLNDFEKLRFRSIRYFTLPVATMMHRKMLQNAKFDENVFKGEDSLFMAVISKNIQRIQKTSKGTCYFVYERVGSTTRRKVKMADEIKNSLYLTVQYLNLFFRQDYNKVFIGTRVLATVLRVFKTLFNYSCL